MLPLLALFAATVTSAQPVTPASVCGAPDAVTAATASRQFQALASRSARTRQRAVERFGAERMLRVGGTVTARYDAAGERLWFGNAAPPAVAIPARVRSARPLGQASPTESLFGVGLPGDEFELGSGAPSMRVGPLRVRTLDLDRSAACVFRVYALEGDSRPTVRLDRIELVVAGYGEPIVWSWAFAEAGDAPFPSR